MLNLIVENWLKDMKRGQVRFAFLETCHAIYDRVAVLTDKATGLYIQYPKKRTKRWTIEKETIPANHVVSLRYYVD